MSTVLIEIFIIFVLLLANGVFAMTEIAVVSSRKARLKKMADEGSARARAALALVEEPTRFLSTVQIGITLIGTLAGAVGGTRLADKLAVWLTENIPAVGGYAEWISILVVVGAITYFSSSVNSCRSGSA
jgi:putative hemolysin